MKISVMTSTGDDDLINPEEKGDLEYRKQQLKKLQDEVVDIEEMSGGISIMDLGLNEFRLDLLEYIKAHVELFDELGENEDFEKVAQDTITKLNNSGFKLDLADVWQEIEGSCSGFYRERFASLEEAFEQIPVAFDNIYNYLNGKGFYIIEMLEHYNKI